ncbi:MAG: response regulator [Desulfovibrio sp.]|jgi:signal transduction histidine kinase/CheY-like chemotaxis protein|nr:response regulator [Desulfovibrio sp.]
MRSLRAKLIAPFVLGTLILTVTLAGYTYLSARQAVQDAMLLISEAKTNHAVSSMSLLFKSMSTALQNMVADPHVMDLFQAQPGENPNSDQHEVTTEWLEIIIQGNEFYRDILVVDRNGLCIASSNLGHVGNSYADKPYVRDALNGRFNFGEASVGRVTRKFSVTGAGPVDTGDGTAGALVIVNDFPKIVDYDAHTTHDAQTVFTAMLTPEGEFMAHKEREFLGKTTNEYQDLYADLSTVGESGGTVEYTLRGETYIGYAKVESTDKWLVVTSGIKNEVFASAYRQGMMVLIISFVFLCATVFVVVRFANGILSSLFELVGYAENVAAGDFDRQLPPSDRTDELGILHNSLQSLVLSLQSMLLKTQEAGRMKDAFLANMSHEIRTPLNAVSGMTHLLLRDGNLTEKQRDYLDKIQVAAGSLLGLINDILDLSKVEAGMLTVDSVPFNLRENCKNILTIHQETAKSKGLALSLEYDAGAPQRFIGDPLRIGQVLNNLLGNALKFTARGGVTLRCAPDRTAETGDGWAVMRCDVTDTGIGIENDALGILFQPFTQADSSVTRKFGGTGLGLTISQKLVSLMGGAVTVTSRPGEGSTFSFSLRLQLDTRMPDNADSGTNTERTIENLGLKGKRILVAEDNEINQMIVQELLAPCGAEIVPVDNGLEAAKAVSEQHFDLVLMDMQMPVMDGLEATRVIRSLNVAGDLPIVAVTANAMNEDKEKGFACGMNDYLTKPVEPEDLLRILRIWLVER